MAEGDHGKEAPGSGGAGQANFWATSAEAAKGAAAVAFAFFAVIALAFFLFAHHKHERKLEIDSELAQNAARLGREVELKYKNYRVLVDNVTRVTTQAAATVTTEGQRQVANAQAALADARKLEQEQRAILEQARKRQKDAAERGKRATSTTAEGQSKATEQQNSCLQTEAELAAAESAASATYGVFNRSLDDFAEKKLAFDAANKAVNDAQEKFRLATAQPAQPALAPAPSSAPGSSRAPVSAEAALAKSALDTATNYRAGAEKALLDARIAVDGAETQASAAAARANSLDGAAKACWLTWNAAASATAATSQDAAVATQTAEQAASATKKAQGELETKAAETDKSAQRLEQATNVSTSIDRYLDRLKELVLPSQRTSLDVCRSAGDTSRVNVCVAKQLLVLNDATDIEIEPCETTSPIPSVSQDGRYLLIPPTSVGAAGTKPPACGRVKLTQFLSAANARSGGTSPPAERVFEAVVLLRRDGTALSVRDPAATLRISALPGFDAKRPNATGIIPDIDLGAAHYRAYLQPVRLRLDAAQDKEVNPEAREHADLVLAGLARSDQLEKDSQSLTLPYYLWFVLLLALGLLSLPLAKLWLLGPKTAFQTIDVTVLATATLLFTLLGTTLVLAFLAHNRLAARADDQLTAVGTKLSRSIQDKLQASFQALETAETQLAASLPALLTDDDSGAPADAATKACDAIDGIRAGSVMFDDGRTRSFCEVPSYHGDRARPDAWKHVFALDRQGNERVKLSHAARNTTAISLASRPYFKQAMRASLAHLGPEQDRAKGNGVAEFVRAATSGNMVLIVAKPVCKGEEKDGARCDDAVNAQGTTTPVGVLGAETDMKDVRSLVLPLGVEAALIDAGSNVMLHSDNDAHHEQILLEEVDSPDELRAALAAKVPATLSLNYLGQPSRVHVEPVRLPDLGWSVVTIESESIVDIATVHTVLLTLFSYGLLVSVVVVLGCLLLVYGRFISLVRHGAGAKESRLTLRPHVAHSDAYATLGVRAIVVGFGVCAAAMLTTRWVPTTAWLVVVLVVCGVAFSRIPCDMHAQAGRAARGWRGNLPLTYLLCIAGLSEVFVMMPATVLFAGAHDHVIDTLARAELTHFGSALTHREACLRALSTPASCEGVVGSGEEQGVPSTSDGSTPRAATGRFLSSSILWPLPVLADYLPRVGARELEDGGRLYRIETTAEARPASTTYTPRRDRTSMRLESTFEAPNPIVARMTLPPLLGMDSQYHWLSLFTLVLLAAAAAAAAYVAGYHSLKRLFFIDTLVALSQRTFGVDEVMNLQRREEVGFPRRALCLQTSALVRKELAASARQLLSEDETPNEEAADGQEALHVVVDFDALVEDPANAEGLRRLSTSAGSVVLLADADPLERIPEAQRPPWIAVLEPFKLVRLTAASGPRSDAASDEEHPSRGAVEQAWLESGDEERRCLTQIAIGGYATPHPANTCALLRLAARGLIHSETFTIIHEELAEHARQATSPEQQAAWAEADKSTAWAALRVPLTTGVASLLGALTMSNPELGFASAIVPTLTASLPTVLKLLLPLQPRG